MNIRKFIQSAVNAGQQSLSESQSKSLLASYGVPISHERPAQDIEQAVAAAENLGFPVVLKADAAGIAHKTEAGLVVLNLSDLDAVREEAANLLNAAPDGSNLLVQEMVRGQRELMMGMKRDAQYGPCVSFGLGGVFAEALDNVTLRLAPLIHTEALSMLDEIRGSEILGDYRGMARVDRDAMAKALIGLGRCALDHPEITEIDVNPIVVTDLGRPIAVDALVVLGPKSISH